VADLTAVDEALALAEAERLRAGEGYIVYTFPVPELDALAEAISARVGLVSSGSSLDATSDELAQFARLRTLAKDMELAALAAVCATEQVPLIALKGVTDLVDRHEPAHEAFVRNFARTSGRLADAAPTLLRALVSR
jgi:nucleoside phosphorylase